MKRLLAVAALLLLAGCVSSPYTVVEGLGGKYDAKLVLENVTTTKGFKAEVLKVLYTYDGQERRGIVPEDMLPALEAIRQGAPENATVVMWWDYASALRGYTGRDVLFDAPSRQILYSVAGKWDGELAADERVRDVSMIFTTNSSQEAAGIMAEYGAEFVLVHATDADRAFVFFSMPTGDSGEYLKFLSNGAVVPTAKGYPTLFFRMYRGEEIPGFSQFYVDDSTHVYRVEPATSLS